MKEKIKTWFYNLHHGHPFILEEEVNIICETRNDEKYKWMSDIQIQRLIKVRIKYFYKKKYPNSKQWLLF